MPRITTVPNTTVATTDFVAPATTVAPSIQPLAFVQTVAALKQGVEGATAARAAASQKAITTAQDVVAFNQSTLEAFTTAGKLFATGSQDLVRQMAESSQAAFNETLAGFSALVAAKTVKERFELQAGFARTSAAWAVSETSRFVQAGIELAEKASAPLTARATLAAEAFVTTKA